MAEPGCPETGQSVLEKGTAVILSLPNGLPGGDRDRLRASGPHPVSGRSGEWVSQHRHVTSGRPWADLTHTQGKTEERCVGGRFQGAKQSRRARSREGAVRKAGDRGGQGMSKVRRHPTRGRGRARGVGGKVAMEAKVPGKAKAVTEGALGKGDFWIQSGMRGEQPLQQLLGEPGFREG